jgi:hypothetical protein
MSPMLVILFFSKEGFEGMGYIGKSFPLFSQTALICFRQYFFLFSVSIALIDAAIFLSFLSQLL